MSTALPSTKPAQGRPRLVEDLIFDVGMHRGEDTAHYLRKGFRVVGFEANPEHVETCRERFAGEIARGRVQIVSGAISDAHRDPVTFYMHPRMSGWGTVLPRRNDAMGPRIDMTVSGVDFPRCLREYGVPYYLKIDIEGSDMLCLEALLDVEPEQRPRYTSIEAESKTWSGVLRQFDLLDRLGYTCFAVVQQSMIRRRYRHRRITTRDGRSISYRFEVLSSGPFGDDLKSRWVDKQDAVRRYRWILPTLRAASAFDRVVPKGMLIRFLVGLPVGRAPLPGWFDIHAARR